MPYFNHTRDDGFYAPCDLCWTEMTEADKIKSVLGMSDDPYEDRCSLECIQSTGASLTRFLNELRIMYQFPKNNIV